jgi:Ca2+-binding RTX toxin-like protein
MVFYSDIPVARPFIVEEPKLISKPLIITRVRQLSVSSYQLLEQRQLLASVIFDSGIVSVYGSVTNDVIELVGSANYESFTVKINSEPSLTKTFSYVDVTQVTVYAGSGDDRVTNTLLRDTLIYGGSGNDYIEGGYRNDVLFGGDGDNTLVGGNGNDTLRGHSGTDWIFGGNGMDRLFGGAGNDYLRGDNGDDELHGERGADRLFGGEDNDRLFGELGNDELAGENGNDLLIGGAGDDLLQGNSGNDLLNGNEGADTINAGPGDDTVYGGVGDDVITGFDGINFLNGNGGNDRINGGQAVDNIQGGSGDDFLAGHQGNDVLIGGSGDDRILGNEGNDLLNGNEGNDSIIAGLGDDTANGGTGHDFITGIEGRNTLNGNGGNDRIHGGHSVDSIRGGSGSDFLAGAKGNDVLFGGPGNDSIFGGSDDDRLEGEQGDDSLYGQQGDDFLVGDQGDDLIFGNDGNDEILASFGNDRINGGSGSDLLYYFSNENNLRVDPVGTSYRVTDLRVPAELRTYRIDQLSNVEELAIGEESNVVRRPIADTVSRMGDSNEVVARINDVLPDGWSSRVRIVGDDVWLRTVKPNGTTDLDFRLGSAGVIAEIRDGVNGQSLLAPSFKGEVTDWVVQWTVWEGGPTVRHDVPSLPDFEDRFNMTQAGTFDNLLNGTADVDVDSQRGQVDVWSIVDRNWKSEQDPHMDGTITALTRTTILDGGAILIRRVVRIGEIQLNGAPVSLASPFFEAWTPLSDSAFDSLALSIDARGNPDQWFTDGQDIPRYQHTNVRNTRGWATGFVRQNSGGGNNLSVVYGTDKGTVYRSDGSETTSHSYQLNTLDFAGGMAILPALFPGTLSEGAIIDQHLILLPRDNINSSTPIVLDALADQLPPPRVYHAGAELRGELSTIANRLSNLTGETRIATDNIGRLL